MQLKLIRLVTFFLLFTFSSNQILFAYPISQNQLIRIQGSGVGDQVIEYRYDGLGKRIEKKVSGVITRYVYDGEDILLEFDGSNQLLARHTHGPGIVS